MSDAKQLYLTPDELDSIFMCVNFYKHKTDGECDQSPKTELSEILCKINRPPTSLTVENILKIIRGD